MKVSDYIAKFLHDRGVGDVFMLTGNGSMHLTDSFARSGMKYWCARNEAAAPMMASAYARLKRSVGAVCLTSGPGSTNAVPGLAEAWVDSAPVVVVSGQVQRSHCSRKTLMPLRSFGTAEIDIIPIVKPLTKYAAFVDRPQDVRFCMEKAFHDATAGRSGPVWLDVPMDVQEAEVDPEKMAKHNVWPFRDEAQENVGDACTEISEIFSKCKRPLILAGNGACLSQGAWQSLSKLVRGCRIPVCFSRFACQLMSASHPLNMGLAGLKGMPWSATLMRAADLVLVLGCRMSPQVVGHGFDAFASDAKIVVVDNAAEELSKPGVMASLGVRSDVGKFLLRLNDKMIPCIHQFTEWTDSCRRLKESNQIEPGKGDKYAIDLYWFMQRLDAASNERHVLVTDAGSNYYVGGQSFRFERGQREICPVTFASMGLSIPTAIGCAVADPGKQILAVTGDGSLELNVQELKTLSHYGLNVKLFVINNGGYLSMRNWQDGFFEGRRIDTAEGTGAGTLNMRKVAEAFGLNYRCILDPDSVDEDLQELLSVDGPQFVEVLCDQNQKILTPDPNLRFDC